MEKLRIGIIGTGGIANQHIQAYLRRDDIEIVEGLSVGEPVVVRGAGFLRDGNPIRVAATRAETAIDVKKAGIAQ